MSYLKNTAGQYLYFAMIAKADGSAITSGTVNGYRSLDGGSQAAVTGTISHKGNGQWELALSQADTNGDEVGYLFTHASGIPVSITVVTDTKKVGTLQDLSSANAQTAAAAALTAYDPPTKAELDAGLAGLNDLDATAVQTAAAAALTAYDPPTKAELDAGLAGLNDFDPATDTVKANVLQWLDAYVDEAPPYVYPMIADEFGTYALTLRHIRDAMRLAPTTTPGSEIPPETGGIDDLLSGLNDLDATAVQSAAAAALTAYDPPTKAELDAGLAGLNDATAGEIADAVWDEALAGHAMAGSAGAGLTAAGSAGDPWATPLPGAYGAGTAGNILGSNLDAAVSSRSDFDPAADQVDVGKVSGDAAAADNLEAMLDGTGGATLSLGKLAIVSTDADAAVVVSNSVGHGVQIAAPAAGKVGLDVSGWVAGLYARGTSSGSHGAYFTGNGSPHNGIYGALVGNVTGNVTGSVGSVTGLTNATIADAIWDELLAGHAISGSAGEALAGAGGGGGSDPWATAVPGAYAAGTAGYLLGTYLDAAISSRSDFDAGADQVDVGAIATAVAQAIADEVLKRGVANVEDTANAASLAAIILATLESSISGSTWTIRKTAGGTFATKTVTTDAGAEPIVGVD